jgi:GT2 family glycosyltransferase
MPQMPKFTLIIPVKEINVYVLETVSYILKLNQTAWELLIIPNESSVTEWRDERIRVIPSGRVGPGLKRDLGAEKAKGEILVFLDDDSYPRKDLLDVALKYFANDKIAAIGGPAITPAQDPFWARVSGAVFLSRFAGGSPERYVPFGPSREVDDWPSVNLMMRRADFMSVGGFSVPYWPGEDTKLCLDIVKTGRKIIYAPDLIVWHHRRPGLAAHLKQLGAYGLHRGYFARIYPETSFKLQYFIPSAFLLFVVLSVFLPLMPSIAENLFFAGWILYGAALLLALRDFLKYERLSVSLCSMLYMFLTHLVYGARFIQGFALTKNLVSKLR